MPVDLTSLLTAFKTVAGFWSNVTSVLAGVQKVADQISPLFFCVAFVLLVFGTMRGFMQNNNQQVFGNVLRAVVLVALIQGWPAISNLVSSAAQAFCNQQITADFGTLGNGTTTGRLDLQQLTNLIAQKVSGGGAASTVVPPGGAVQTANQSWLGNITNPGAAIQSALNPVVSVVTHALCLVLYAIFLLTLLLCELIVVLMELLQQALLIFLGVYVPVAFAEFSIQSLRGQAQAFFKTYIGVQCWPVGWVFVNIVTIALFSKVVAPNQEDPVQVLCAVVTCVPVLLWVLIGHVLAPFYAQKLIVRGGAELQAFVGAMITSVGGTTGAVFGQAFAFSGKGIRALAGSAGMNAVGAVRAPSKYRSSDEGSRPDRESTGGDGDGRTFGGEELLGRETFLPTAGPSSIPRPDSDFLRQANRLGVLGLLGKASELGQFGSRTAGNMSQVLGAMVADASGNRLGPEGRFRFPQTNRPAPNRSSRRAAAYLTSGD